MADPFLVARELTEEYLLPLQEELEDYIDRVQVRSATRTGTDESGDLFSIPDQYAALNAFTQLNIADPYQFELSQNTQYTVGQGEGGGSLPPAQAVYGVGRVPNAGGVLELRYTPRDSNTAEVLQEIPSSSTQTFSVFQIIPYGATYEFYADPDDPDVRWEQLRAQNLFFDEADPGTITDLAYTSGDTVQTASDYGGWSSATEFTTSGTVEDVELFARDGTNYIAYVTDSAVTVHDFSTGNLVQTLTEGGNFFRAVDATSDGSQLAYAYQGGARVYDTTDWSLIQELTDVDSLATVYGLEFGYKNATSSNDTVLALGGFDTDLFIYDTSDWSVLAQPTASSSTTITDVSFSPQSLDPTPTVAFSTEAGNVSVHALNQTGWAETGYSPISISGEAGAVEFNPGGSANELAIGSRDSTLKIYNTATAVEKENIDTPSSINTLHYGLVEPPERLFVGTDSGTVYVYDTDNGPNPWTIRTEISYPTDSTDQVRSLDLL